MAGGSPDRLAKRPMAAPPRTPEEPILSPRFFDEVNKGPLEAECERRLEDRRSWTPIPWGWMTIGIVIGVLFAYVNAYAALAIGVTVGGSWYLSYFLGLLARLRPGAINYVAGASTGASQAILGIAFVVPALFLLSDRGSGAGILSFDDIPSPFALAGFFLVGGLYGVLFFLFYRRVWIVERPLPYPGGFDTSIELLSLAGAARAKDRSTVRQSLFVLTVAALVSGFFVVLRDLLAFGPSEARQGYLDRLFGGRYYAAGNIPDIGVFRPFYGGLLYADPFFLAIGWFIRARIATILLLGAVLAHLLPFFDASAEGAFGLFLSWAANRRTLAAGAILGAGVLAIIRLRKVILDGARTMLSRASERASEGGPRPAFLLVGLLVGGWFLASFFLVAGGAPIGASLLVVPVALVLLGILGLVAVKVTGETSIQPVSPFTLLALLALIGVLTLSGSSGATLLVMALGAAAFFATGLVMSTDIFLDSKLALYVGNPPHRQAIAQVVGLVPGVLIGTAIVWFLAGRIVDGEAAALTAPQGLVFSGLAQAFTGGDIDWTLFLLAAGIGAAVELATGLGTAFGIGVALGFFAPFTIFVGAMARSVYERFARRRGEETGPVQALVRIVGPTGVYVGASIAAIVVFAMNEWVL